MEKLYVKNESLEDYKECRALIDTSAKLFGWNEPEEKNINIKTFDINKIYADDQEA